MMKNEERIKKQVYNKLFITIDNIRSHSKIKLVDKKNLRFKVVVKLASRLLETTEALDLVNHLSVKVHSRKKWITNEKEVKKLLLRFKKLGIDPVGFGNEYVAQVKRKNDFEGGMGKEYKNATFDVHVKNTIERTGVID